MTILIGVIIAVVFVLAVIGQYNKDYGVQNELRKIRKQNERRGR